MAYVVNLCQGSNTYSGIDASMPSSYRWVLASTWLVMGTAGGFNAAALEGVIPGFTYNGFAISMDGPFGAGNTMTVELANGTAYSDSPNYYFGQAIFDMSDLLEDTLYNVIVSIDSVSNIVQCAVNGVLRLPTLLNQWQDATNITRPGEDYSPYNVSLGGSGLGLLNPSCVGDMYLALPGSFFDLTVSGNIEKFISGGQPVDLGLTATSVLGVEPLVYLTRRNGDPVSAFQVNRNTTVGGTPLADGYVDCPITPPPPPPPPPPPLPPPVDNCIPKTKVSPRYIQWILDCDRAIMGHLYKFTSVTGIPDYFTDMDIDINFNHVTWKSQSLRFEGLQRKLSVGLSVDEQTMKIWASPTDTLFGSNFLTGAEQGLLDGATIVRYRIIWAFFTGNAEDDVKRPPVAFWPLQTGYTSSIQKGGVSHIELKVRSALSKLNVNMPRNYYQPGCLWTLFDQGCTLNKDAFGQTAAVDNGATPIVIPISGGIPTPTGADTYPNYSQGRLLFTSGVNAGLQVLIDSNSATQLYLAYALDAVPSFADAVIFYPGCSKSFNTCDKKFNNKANFRGFDKVPPIMISA